MKYLRFKACDLKSVPPVNIKIDKQPEIISFRYKNYEVVDRKWITVCKKCGSRKIDGDATTSNFI